MNVRPSDRLAALALLAGLAVGGPARSASPANDIDMPVPERGAPAPIRAPMAITPAEVQGDLEAPFIPGVTDHPGRGVRRPAEAPNESPRPQPALPGPTAPRDLAPTPAEVPGVEPRPAPFLRMPPSDGDGRLDALWIERRDLLRSRSYRAAQEVESQLDELRQEMGYLNLFAYSAAVAREAEGLLGADPSEALRRALLATALAPDLPHAHWTAARAALAQDASNLGPALGHLVRALDTSAREPRWRGALVAEVGAGLLLALVLGGSLFLLLVFARHVRCLMHDFRHLFPVGAPLALTTPIAALALALPWAAGAGPFASLLAVALVVWIHASLAERIVLGSFLVLLGLVPQAAGRLAEAAAFQGTAAESLHLVDRGGHESPGRRADVRALGEAVPPTFQSCFVLGRQARRRGDGEAAAGWLRRAAELRPDSAEALTELGNALVLLGDLEGAREAYQRAAGSARVEPLVALARLQALLARTARAEDASEELRRQQEYVRMLIALDHRQASLANVEPDRRANRFFMDMPLPVETVRRLAQTGAGAAQIEEEAARRIFGSALPRALAPWSSLAVVGALALLFLLGSRAAPSRSCVRCGRPVCVRCDQVAQGPRLCGQCVHVFSGRASVDPAARTAKEMGIRRFLRLRTMAVMGLAALPVAGAAHVVLGRTVAGFLLLTSATGLWVQAAFALGLVRSPVGSATFAIRVAPLLLLAVVIHLLATRWALAAVKDPAPRP